MKKPGPHPKESERLATLRSLGLLDSAAEERFDRITRVAKFAFGVETSLVSLVDGERQWFKSIQGLDAQETPRDVSFCGHAVASDSPLVVTDSIEDERFADNPLVTGGPEVRFYAGHLVRASNGMPLGTLCIIDPKPRAFSPEEEAVLADLAAMVQAEINLENTSTAKKVLQEQLDEVERRAATDALTRAWSRDITFQIVDREHQAATANDGQLSLIVVNLDRFAAVNSEHGHLAGDAVLLAVAERIRVQMRPEHMLGRITGDEFLVVMPGSSPEAASKVANLVARSIAAKPFANGVELTASVGIASLKSFLGMSATEFVTNAEYAMRQAKALGGNEVCRADDEDPRVVI